MCHNFVPLLLLIKYPSTIINKRKRKRKEKKKEKSSKSIVFNSDIYNAFLKAEHIWIKLKKSENIFERLLLWVL